MIDYLLQAQTELTFKEYLERGPRLLAIVLFGPPTPTSLPSAYEYMGRREERQRERGKKVL
jgi:hypothetical protein